MKKNAKHTTALNDDAFEREAAEGFDLLGTDEDIAALKAETDKAFAQQLKQHQKNEKAPWLWMAAAFVIVGLGLTLFSVLSPERKMDVAQVPSSSQVEVPSDAQVYTETTVQKPRPQTTPTITREEEAPAAKLSQNPQVQANPSLSANEQEMDMEESAPAAAAEPQLVATELKAPTVYASSSSNAGAVYTASAAPSELNIAADKALIVQKEEDALGKKKAETKALRSKQSAPAAANDEKADVTVNAIIYNPGQKQLEADAKILLKNFQLPKEIMVELYLDADAHVVSAKISSKDSIAEADKLAAQIELKKLSNFTVTPAPGAKFPYSYRFTLKR